MRGDTREKRVTFILNNRPDRAIHRPDRGGQCYKGGNSQCGKEGDTPSGGEAALGLQGYKWGAWEHLSEGRRGRGGGGGAT